MIQNAPEIPFAWQKIHFFLDCDGRLHLLRIDRLETACEGSNGALLMLSMLLQKNAEIVRHAV